MEEFVQRLREIRPETVIPKPAARERFVVKGWGKRRGETALIYLIPNHKDPKRPHQKGVTISECKAAFERLGTEGEFTRQWFKEALPACSGEGDCNFTTIGGILCLLGYGRYAERGVYRTV